MWMPAVRTIADAATNDDGYARDATGHVVKIRCLVHELIHGSGDEFAEADLNDRSLPEECRAYGCTDHGRFGNRRVADPVRAEFGE